jgi:hypothetical protein
MKSEETLNYLLDDEFSLRGNKITDIKERTPTLSRIMLVIAITTMMCLVLGSAAPSSLFLQPQQVEATALLQRLSAIQVRYLHKRQILMLQQQKNLQNQIQLQLLQQQNQMKKWEQQLQQHQTPRLQ